MINTPVTAPTTQLYNFFHLPTMQTPISKASLIHFFSFLLLWVWQSYSVFRWVSFSGYKKTYIQDTNEKKVKKKQKEKIKKNKNEMQLEKKKGVWIV